MVTPGSLRPKHTSHYSSFLHHARSTISFQLLKALVWLICYERLLQRSGILKVNVALEHSFRKTSLHFSHFFLVNVSWILLNVSYESWSNIYIRIVWKILFAFCLFAETTNKSIALIHPSNIRLAFRRGQSSLFELPNKDFDKYMQKRGSNRNILI